MSIFGDPALSELSLTVSLFLVQIAATHFDEWLKTFAKK